jgi:hypothetical protein
MSKIHFHQTTRPTAEQYIAGLTDFGPGRSKVFSKNADDCLIEAIQACNDGASPR